jgi:hypothetical protein
VALIGFEFEETGEIDSVIQLAREDELVAYDANSSCRQGQPCVQSHRGSLQCEA